MSRSKESRTDASATADEASKTSENKGSSDNSMVLPLFDHKLPQFPTAIESPLSQRKLKIEAAGDSWKGRIKPKIRLMGRWLERAGFRPGETVLVTCVAPGILELRSSAQPTSNEGMQIPSEQSNCPF